MRLRVLLIATAMIAVSPTAALANFPYTFSVPVSTTNNGAGAEVQVQCYGYTGANGTGSVVGTSGPNGVSDMYPLTNGAFTGVVTAKLVATTKPASYGCEIVIWSNGSQAGSVPLNFATGSHTTPAPGWSGTMYTTGSLP